MNTILKHRAQRSLTRLKFQFKFTVFYEPPFDLVVQSAVSDLSACHAIVLCAWCNFRVSTRRATFGKRSFPGEARSTSVITLTVITVCGFHPLDAKHDRKTSTEVTYGTLNNKIEQRYIETVNLTGISVELDFSAASASSRFMI